MILLRSESLSLHTSYSQFVISRSLQRPFQTPALKEKGLVFPVDFTVGRLMNIVDAMEEEHSGGMYDWSGQAIPF